MEWQPIETAPSSGPFTAWCRWYLVPDPQTTSGDAKPYWTDWAPRWAWMNREQVRGSGDSLYHVQKVEATHWMPLPEAPRS